MSVLSRLAVASALLDLNVKRVFRDLLAVGTVAATGSASTNAAALTTGKNVVTGADGTKGVILPLATVDMATRVVNTDPTSILKVYPGSGDQINSLTVTTGAYSIHGGREATFHCDVKGHWYVARFDMLDLSSESPTSHPINLSSVTLAASMNAIRGASVNPTRTSGWISFSGTVGATPAQVYTDYRELHTTGVAEVLGAGLFPFMDSGAACASMFAVQAICEADAGSTVLTAAGAPAIGIFPLFAKCLINSATFNSGGVAAAAFMSFQANVTDVQSRDTSIINAEVASGGIQNVIKFQCSAAKGATYLFNFTDDNGEPVSLTNGSDLNDISATANQGWIKVLVGSTVRYIPLYAVKA